MTSFGTVRHVPIVSLVPRWWIRVQTFVLGLWFFSPFAIGVKKLAKLEKHLKVSTNGSFKADKEPLCKQRLSNRSKSVIALTWKVILWRASKEMSIKFWRKWFLKAFYVQNLVNDVTLHFEFKRYKYFSVKLTILHSFV